MPDKKTPLIIRIITIAMIAMTNLILIWNGMKDRSDDIQFAYSATMYGYEYNQVAVHRLKEISKELKFKDPLKIMCYTSAWGVRGRPKAFTGGPKKAFHAGIDLSGTIGTLVYAVAEGKVIKVGWDGGYGRRIIISHKNYITTLYGHLDKILAKLNSIVTQGQIIGMVGDTGRSSGPHLHFSVMYNGYQIDPLIFLGI